MTVSVHAIPGHTAGSVSVLTDEGDIKNLQKSFTGASDKLRDTINQNL